MIASSPPAQPALRVMVRAGMTAGQALRDGRAPTRNEEKKDVGAGVVSFRFLLAEAAL